VGQGVKLAAVENWHGKCPLDGCFWLVEVLISNYPSQKKLFLSTGRVKKEA
jgi:hypothetical protein